jgi:hypothetical protein
MIFIEECPDVINGGLHESGKNHCDYSFAESHDYGEVFHNYLPIISGR